MEKTMREKILDMIVKFGEGHLPSSFSIVDIIEHLYDRVLRHDPKRPDWSERDYFVLSKGHGCAALYVVLEKHGYLTHEQLDNYCRFDSILGGHPDRTKVPGVEASTGSLGHGLQMAVGIAMGLRIQGKPNRVFALVGDAECNEGTTWEAALVAAHRELGNLVCIVDNNKSSEVVLPVRRWVDKFTTFGWDAREIDGHDPRALTDTFSSLPTKPTGKPIMIVANTVKGKGVSFMEADFGKWHHKVPVGTELEQAYTELRAASHSAVLVGSSGPSGEEALSGDI